MLEKGIQIFTHSIYRSSEQRSLTSRKINSAIV